MFVGVDQLLALAGADGDGNDLLGEDAVLLRGDRPLMRRHRQLVLLLPGDRVLPAQVLCGLQHAAGHRVVAPARGGASAGQCVVHLDAGSGSAPTHIRRIEGDVAHALGTARDDEIVVAVGNLQARLDHGLQTRAAPPVDLHAWHGHRQAGVQRDDAADRGCLAARIAVAENDVLHCGGLDPGAVEQPLECRDAEVHRGQRLEHAAVAADRRAYRFTDDGLAVLIRAFLR